MTPGWFTVPLLAIALASTACARAADDDTEPGASPSGSDAATDAFIDAPPAIPIDAPADTHPLLDPANPDDAAAEASTGPRVCPDNARYHDEYADASVSPGPKLCSQGCPTGFCCYLVLCVPE